MRDQHRADQGARWTSPETPAHAAPGGASGAPCSAHTPLVEVAGLGVCYPGVVALEDVELAIPEGLVTALVGPSGCGKTSFLQVLNRLTDLVPGCELTGSVRVAGHEVIGDSIDLGWLRRSVGMIFQRPNPFPLSIRENLHLPLREHTRWKRAERDRESERVLRAVGLWNEVHDRLDAPALQLSGGQQQRLCLARALTLRPRLLLLDEPCSALDPLATETIEALLRSLRGLHTLLIVTHNLAQARRLADHVLVFWHRDGRGQLIEAGPAAQVFGAARDPDAAAYLRGERG